jgi:SAM-dependent methyltransferase
VAGFDMRLFGDDYLWFWAGVLTDERSDAEADLAWRLLALEPGVEVLDLACGHGRIANRLAARGARVTGLDATPPFLELARGDARERGVRVEYVEGDMREIPWETRFDAALNWFTAFGYHDDDELHAILAGVRRALRPGGRFALETINLHALLPRFERFGVTARDGDFLLELRSFDTVRSRIDTEYVAVRGGGVRRYPTSIRMFGFPELRDWLLAAGFARVDPFGGDGEPLAAEQRRMIAVAHA